MFLIDIDHVQLAAPRGSEAEARRFFGRILGLAEIAKPGPLRSRGGCWFKIGTRQLHIGVEDPFRPASKAHPAFAVRNIDALFSSLAEHGVPGNWGETISGIRRFYVNDPWGNRIEFTAAASAEA
jgi:catechol 2,3-dioxygenase-like lactoylglutathione lyase family enzyme